MRRERGDLERELDAGSRTKMILLQQGNGGPLRGNLGQFAQGLYTPIPISVGFVISFLVFLVVLAVRPQGLFPKY